MWKYLVLSICIWGSIGILPGDTGAFDLEIVTEEWAPYNYKDGDVLTGFSVEIVRAIIAELGEKHEIHLYPPARSSMMIEKMPNVMKFSWFRTPAREKNFKWIGPISQDAVYFYKKKGDQRVFKTIEDIKRADNITVPHRGLILRHVEALGITNITKIPNKEGQFLHLFRGEADLCVNSTPLGIAYYLEMLNMPADALVQTQVKLLEFPLYIACSKAIPDSVVTKWQKALDRVKASGQYKRIYDKYLN